MGSNYKMTYAVDIVFVIDATNSMTGLIETIKAHTINFYKDLVAKMTSKNKCIGALRIKLIIFRDYLADEKDAMRMTRFYVLPAETKEFEQIEIPSKEENWAQQVIAIVRNLKNL